MSSTDTWLSPNTLFMVFTMIGVIACSVSGALLAKHKQFDVFGCLLVAMVTAIGGGTVRDLILDRHPLFWMTDLSYLLVISTTALLCVIFFNPQSQRVHTWLKLFDAIGLAAFTLTGIKVSLVMGASAPVAMLLGVVTIVVGGIIRDMICNEIPLVLQQEIYISAALVGGGLYFALQLFWMPEWIREIACMVVIFSIRMLAIRYDWQFPDLNWQSN